LFINNEDQESEMNSKDHESVLLKRRIIPLRNTVYEDEANRVIDCIDYLEGLDPTQPILISLNCIGGGYDPQMRVIDRIHNCEPDVNVLVQHEAYSAGFNIVQACKRRMTYPNAKLIYHMLSMAHTRPDQPEYKEALANSWRLHEIMVREHSKRCGHSKEMWREWSAENHVFKAYDALKLNIIDEVVNKANYSWQEEDGDPGNVFQLSGQN
jgi:ATP-dependent protease ClpP protease subunit